MANLRSVFQQSSYEKGRQRKAVVCACFILPSSPPLPLRLSVSLSHRDEDMISIASLSSTGIPDEDLEEDLEEDDDWNDVGGSREDLVGSASPRPTSPFVSTLRVLLLE